jgi:hypothetical protein
MYTETHELVLSDDEMLLKRTIQLYAACQFRGLAYNGSSTKLGYIAGLVTLPICEKVQQVVRDVLKSRVNGEPSHLIDIVFHKDAGFVQFFFFFF